MVQQGEQGSFPCSFLLTAMTMGWLLNFPISQLFLKHQLCPLVRGLGAWMLPSNPEADRIGDGRVALPDPCRAARSTFQQLSKYFFSGIDGFVLARGCFFFPS